MGRFLHDWERGPNFYAKMYKGVMPQCLQYQHIVMPLMVQCFTVGTHSRCLNEWVNPTREMDGLFHEVRVIHTTRGQMQEGVKEEITFFYGKMATLSWDLDRWRWVEGSYFLDYTTKEGREFITKRTEGVNNVADKWQGYVPRNYKFYWSQIWDPLRTGKEAAFMWSIWHKVVAVNEWRARIAPISISKQCIFCLPNTCESVKHSVWDCIQARRAWRWAIFVIHELCGVRTTNYETFHWKQALFGERLQKKFCKQIQIWHLLRGITLWFIWIERNDKVFNQEHWIEAKVKHLIWGELIMYAKVAGNV